MEDLRAIIFAMQCLRNAHRLTRLVLVWFVMAIGVAVASPLVHPQSTTLVCSVGGVMKLLPAGGDADAPVAATGLLDCPMCLQLAAPPATLPGACCSQRATSGPVLEPASVAGIRTAAPLPGRGPPVRA